MAEYENQIVDFKKTNDKPGAWLKLTVITDKGETKTPFLKDAALIELVIRSGPGFYSVKKEKQGQFPEIVGLRFLRPLTTAQSPDNQAGPSGAPTGQPIASPAPVRVAGQVDPNTLLQNKAITAQVCVKAAAELMGKALEAGAFKIKGEADLIDTDGMITSVKFLAGAFMEKAREFVVTPSEPAKPLEKAQQILGGKVTHGNKADDTPPEGA